MAPIRPPTADARQAAPATAPRPVDAIQPAATTGPMPESPAGPGRPGDLPHRLRPHPGRHRAASSDRVGYRCVVGLLCGRTQSSALLATMLLMAIDAQRPQPVHRVGGIVVVVEKTGDCSHDRSSHLHLARFLNAEKTLPWKSRATSWERPTLHRLCLAICRPCPWRGQSELVKPLACGPRLRLRLGEAVGSLGGRGRHIRGMPDRRSLPASGLLGGVCATAALAKVRAIATTRVRFISTIRCAQRPCKLNADSSGVVPAQQGHLQKPARAGSEDRRRVRCNAEERCPSRSRSRFST